MVVLIVLEGVVPTPSLIYLATVALEMVLPASNFYLTKKILDGSIFPWKMEREVERRSETTLPTDKQQQNCKTLGHSNPEEVDDDLLEPKVVQVFY